VDLMRAGASHRRSGSLSFGGPARPPPCVWEHVFLIAGGNRREPCEPALHPGGTQRGGRAGHTRCTPRGGEVGAARVWGGGGFACARPAHADWAHHRSGSSDATEAHVGRTVPEGLPRASEGRDAAVQMAQMLFGGGTRSGRRGGRHDGEGRRLAPVGQSLEVRGGGSRGAASVVEALFFFRLQTASRDESS